MSPADPTHLSVKQMKRLLKEKGVAINVVEINELRNLVRQNASRTDVDDFLLRESRRARGVQESKSTSNTSSTKRSPSNNATSGLPADVETFGERLKQQAKFMREQPALFRSRAPPFQSWSDEQIRTYATTCEKIANDPEQLRKAYEVEKQRAAGGSPASRQPLPSNFADLTDAQIDEVVTQMKENPEMFKQQLVNVSKQLGSGSLGRVDQMVHMFSQMDKSTIKKLLFFARGLYRLWLRLQKMYVKVDQATGGFGKIIFGLLGLVLAYLFYQYLFGPLWYMVSFFPKLILG